MVTVTTTTTAPVFPSMAPQNPLAGKSSCEKFVAGMVGLTTASKKFGRTFVGRDMLSAVELSVLSNEYPTAPVDGFKDYFIKGQMGWAKAHIMGVAGAYLVGDSSVVPGGWLVGKVISGAKQTGHDVVNAQLKQDYQDFESAVAKKDTKRIIETASEINDDHAGIAIGVQLKSYQWHCN